MVYTTNAGFIQVEQKVNNINHCKAAGDEFMKREKPSTLKWKSFVCGHRA